MDKKRYIQSYCRIEGNQVSLNGKVMYKDAAEEVKDFFKGLYKHMEISYRKFFKMDNLSKLAFLASEVLSKDIGEYHRNTAIVLSNKAASLDTDREYQASINNPDEYYPSPAVFVYTLPNIGIGEISIKHQLKSENAFFVFNEYNASFHHNYEELLIKTGKSAAVLAGWTNIDADNYEAFLYLVSEIGEIEHTEQNLNKLYNN